MTQLFFHCSNDDGVWVDQRTIPLNGTLTDVMEQAAGVVRSLVMAPSHEDWRGWTLHASDDLGEEIFAMPFAAVLGRSH